MGEILAFIDDDSYPREDWLRVAEKTFNNISKEFVAVHGPAITPPNATKIEKMSGAFFESRLGGGATYRCKDVEKPFKIDDAPSVNLLVRRKIFLEVGGFGSEYWPGEDSIFCQKLKDNGYKLWHQNNMIVFHHRRKTIRKHLKQVSSYAEHRGNFFRKGIGCSRRVSYLIPYLFLIGNLSILFFIGWGLMPLLFLYFIIISFNLCLCKDLPFYLIPLTAVLTFASHLTYGFYFIKGFGMKEIRSKLR
jgi:GT2 family glycosyltransferase